jgi:hypothetical protein
MRASIPLSALSLHTSRAPLSSICIATDGTYGQDTKSVLQVSVEAPLVLLACHTPFQAGSGLPAN